MGTVYLIWGSTYLAIRVVVSSLPPLGSAGVRFTFAGAVLAAVIVLTRRVSGLRVTGRELRGAAIVGLALLLGGNGLVQLGERDVPSALAALIVGSTPLWIVLYRRIAGERIEGTVLAGVVIGFAGVGLLVVPRGVSGEIAPIGLLFMLLAPASWGWGTFMSKRLAMPRDALASTTLQQVLGGLGLLAAALATGERAEPSEWSDRSLVALGYLVVFGSLVAFSAYTWLLAHVNVSKVSTYAYVNPVVAVLLGALILGEPITPTIVLGGLLVIVAVAFIVRAPEARPPVRSAS